MAWRCCSSGEPRRSSRSIRSSRARRAGPEEVLELSDRILRGVFDGDLAHALERASAFCRVEASGAASIADDQEGAAPERSTELTTRAARLTTVAEELAVCARLARDDALE